MDDGRALEQPGTAHLGLTDEVFDRLPIPVALVELPGTVVRANPAARDILQMLADTPATFEGPHGLADLTGTLGLPPLPSLGNDSRSIRLPAQHGAQDYHLYPIPVDETHTLLALVPRASSVEATDHAKILGEVIEQSFDFVAWHPPDREGPVLNPAAVAILGGELLAGVPLPHRMSDLFTEESRDRIAEVGVPTMNAEGSWRDRLRVRNRDTGEIRHLDWVQFLVHAADGRLVGTAGVGRDVTEQLQNAAAALQRQMLQAQETERRRIAADVHDDSAQALTVVSLRLQRLLPRLEGEDRALLEAALESTGQALERLRQLIFDLHPTALDNRGVASALADFVSLGFDDVSMKTTIEGDDEGVDLDVPTRSAVYRATREAMLNAARHSQGTSLAVRLTPAEGGLFVLVFDDGIGFDPASLAARPGHLGLTGARAQIAAAGGRIEIDSSPGAGTTVTLWVPASVVDT